MKKPATVSEPEGHPATTEAKTGRLTPEQAKARRERLAALGIKPMDPAKIGAGFAIVGVSMPKMRPPKK